MITRDLIIKTLDLVEHSVTMLKLVERENSILPIYQDMLFSVKHSLTGCHQTLSDVLYFLSNPEPKEVEKYWVMSEDGETIEEVDRNKYLLTFQNEDAEDPTNVDRV